MAIPKMLDSEQAQFRPRVLGKNGGEEKISKFYLPPTPIARQLFKGP